jgi:hypothetical protein
MSVNEAVKTQGKVTFFVLIVHGEKPIGDFCFTFMCDTVNYTLATDI